MAEATKDVHDAVVHLLAMQDAAWAAGDAVAFGESALPDVVFTNVVGLFSVGIERFIAQHAHIFSTIYKGSRLEQRLVKITMATADVAIVDSLTTVRGFHRLPPGSTATNGAFHTRLEQVLVCRAGEWRVQSFHNTPLNPAAASVAAPDAGCTHYLGTD